MTTHFDATRHPRDPQGRFDRLTAAAPEAGAELTLTEPDDPVRCTRCGTELNGGYGMCDRCEFAEDMRFSSAIDNAAYDRDFGDDAMHDKWDPYDR